MATVVTKTGFADSLPQLSITTQQGTFTLPAPDAVDLANRIIATATAVHDWQPVDEYERNQRLFGGEPL